MATNNVRFFCKNSEFTTDLDEFTENVSKKFDAFIVTSPTPLRVFRDEIWDNLNPKGLLIVDNIYSSETGEEWFTKFANSVSREPVFFKTRLGIGIIER
jgi:predicted O-methyltransferase YrrM